jgi:hypothetical protein
MQLARPATGVTGHAPSACLAYIAWLKAPLPGSRWWRER